MTDVEKLAEVILEAQKIREESYNLKAANEKGREAAGRLIDFRQFYNLSILDAVKKAIESSECDHRLLTPIYLLSKLAWNDIQDWATLTLAKK